MLSWVMKAKEITMSAPVMGLYLLISLCEEQRHDFGSRESHFHLKVSMTNPYGK